ncbi:sodium:proton antiporter [Glaciecola sp. 33A]|uniref:cation:proton antiporter n=1 Tax=Glaciecola sp. 33A TaxID=2057807 RepID=UPI000C32EA93|nr:cation:proton antiporter [Glaciecola sp. 33A]PKI02696.1 sodium:potassium antiporter [Glaciecola sp. 33A]
MEIGIVLILFCVSGYTMLAKSLSKTVITAPMFFIVLGLVMSQSGILEVHDSKEVLYLIAEIALIIILFLDASQIDLRQLKKQNTWPLRMLLIGLPLSIVLGTLAGYIFFPHWPLVMIALVAAIMAPTDAALGEAVVSNKSVPENERQTLTVESGLNDGLALPIILFLASLVAMSNAPQGDNLDWLIFGASQVLMGIAVGFFMGWSSGRLFLFGESRELTSHIYQGIGVLALTGTSYLMASLLGGNGFISAFVSGLAFGNIVKGHCRFIYQFAESEGQMLVWAAFIVVGLGLLPEALEHLTLPVAGYILVSLFLVRPIAIYISLIGTQSKPITRLFLGWFGPRGLATALFALIVSEQILGDYANAVLVVAINAVWMSVLLHGITASLGAQWYGKHVQGMMPKKQKNDV